MEENNVKVAVKSMLPAIATMTVSQRLDTVDSLMNQIVSLPHPVENHLQIARSQAIMNIDNARQEMNWIAKHTSRFSTVKKSDDNRFTRFIEAALSYVMVAGINETVVRQLVR